MLLAGRRLLVTTDNAQAQFLINTTSTSAPGLIDNLNDNETNARFGEQLSNAGTHILYMLA